MPDAIWDQTLDEGKFRGKVTRVDENTGLLVVSIVETNEELYAAHVPLAYGAVFGPDVDDVDAWRVVTLEVVDSYLLRQEATDA